MDIQDKYIDSTKDYFHNLKKNKNYKNHKMCFKSTHLKGYHIEFYNMPNGFNMKSQRTNFNMFNKKIISYMNNLIEVAGNNIFLPKPIIELMIYQIDDILKTNDLYWQNNGYNEKLIKNIKNTYNMFKLFLENYMNTTPDTETIGIGNTNEGYELYKFCIEFRLGVNIEPNKLQQYALAFLEKLIKEIEQKGNKKYDQIKDDLLNAKSYTDEKDIKIATSQIINDIYYKLKDKFPDDIKILLPSSIKIKDYPKITSKWNKFGGVKDNVLFLNMSKIKLIREYHIKNICLNDTLIGTIMKRINHKKSLKQFNLDNKIKHLMENDICSLKEGWGLMAQEIGKELLGENGDLLFIMSQIESMIKIIIDTGLHSPDVVMKFNIETAKEFIRKYTNWSEDMINAEISRILANPAKECCEGFGYKLLKIIESKYMAKNPNIKEFYKFIIMKPYSVPMLYSYIDNMKI